MCIQRERRDGDDVVHNGSGVAPKVVALRIEYAGDNGRKTVQHDLEREEPKEPYREVEVEVRAGTCGLRPNERRREDKAHHGHHAHEHDHEREQVGRVIRRALASQTLAYGNVDGQKRGDEHAAHDQLVQEVRHGRGNRVAARHRHKGAGQRVGLGHGAAKAGDAADDDEDARRVRLLRGDLLDLLLALKILVHSWNYARGLSGFRFQRSIPAGGRMGASGNMRRGSVRNQSCMVTTKRAGHTGVAKQLAGGEIAPFLCHKLGISGEQIAHVVHLAHRLHGNRGQRRL